MWNEKTLPAGLRRGHRIAAGTWGRISVHRGQLRFRAATTFPIDVVLDARSEQAIPPEIEHSVEPAGPVEFSIQFFAVERRVSNEHRQETEGTADLGGDRACWAGLVCQECGALVSDGHHRPGCPASGSPS
jgi:tellurite resistance-related uncharacterized protein